MSNPTPEVPAVESVQAQPADGQNVAADPGIVSNPDGSQQAPGTLNDPEPEPKPSVPPARDDQIWAEPVPMQDVEPEAQVVPAVSQPDDVIVGGAGPRPAQPETHWNGQPVQLVDSNTGQLVNVDDTGKPVVPDDNEDLNPADHDG